MRIHHSNVCLDTTENEPCDVCAISEHKNPRYAFLDCLGGRNEFDHSCSVCMLGQLAVDFYLGTKSLEFVTTGYLRLRSWKVRSARDRTIRTFQIRVRSTLCQNSGNLARIHQKSKKFENV